MGKTTGAVRKECAMVTIKAHSTCPYGKSKETALEGVATAIYQMDLVLLSMLSTREQPKHFTPAEICERSSVRLKEESY